MTTIGRYLDRIVISSKSFPMKYWDKFVRRKTKQKYREQVDEETLDALLGVERTPGDSSFDYRCSEKGTAILHSPPPSPSATPAGSGPGSF